MELHSVSGVPCEEAEVCNTEACWMFFMLGKHDGDFHSMLFASGSGSSASHTELGEHLSLSLL